MTKPSNIATLMRYSSDYDVAKARWETMIRNLENYCGRGQLIDGQQWDVPKLERRDGNRAVEIAFAGTTVRCEFESLGERSVLRFGYVRSKISGKKAFEYTNRVIVDLAGNVVDGEGNVSHELNIEGGASIDEVFFAACKTVLATAMIDLTRFYRQDELCFFYGCQWYEER